MPPDRTAVAPPVVCAVGDATLGTGPLVERGDPFSMPDIPPRIGAALEFDCGGVGKFSSAAAQADDAPSCHATAIAPIRTRAPIARAQSLAPIFTTSLPARSRFAFPIAGPPRGP